MASPPEELGRAIESDRAPASRDPWFARGTPVSVVIGLLLAGAGSLWISMQPSATHSALDGPLTGWPVRWEFYVVATLLALRPARHLLDAGDPAFGSRPVPTVLVIASLAVVAGTVAEVVARLLLGSGHGVLAMDGVVERILQLVRVDVPLSAIAFVCLIALARPRHGAPSRRPE